MKTTRMAIALAALTTAGCALAQNPEVPRERTPDPFSQQELKELAEREAQLAAAQVDQKREMERALAASQKAVRVAQAQGGVAATAPKAIAIAGSRKGSAGRALIIPKDSADAKSLAEMEEDMNVMAHILDKAASDDKKSNRAMGIMVYGRPSWGGGTSPQNLFIEGSGALFFLNVNYPLQPAPDKDAATETKEKPASEWETAKKEMAAPRAGSADNFFAFGESFERAFAWDGGSSAPYDADKVEDLKNDLLPALKNAANIRKLKADETVTVIVIGPSASAGSKTLKNKPDDKAMRLREEDLAATEAKVSERAPAKLVLRVKKSDAEAFQNGKLNLDDFKKKVTVMNY